MFLERLNIQIFVHVYVLFPYKYQTFTKEHTKYMFLDIANNLVIMNLKRVTNFTHPVILANA